MLAKEMNQMNKTILFTLVPTLLCLVGPSVYIVGTMTALWSIELFHLAALFMAGVNLVGFAKDASKADTL